MMEKILKFLPFMPPKADTGKLVLAILFYAACLLIGTPIVSLILFPLAFVLTPACHTYCVAGILLAILAYNGKTVDIVEKDED